MYFLSPTPHHRAHSTYNVNLSLTAAEMVFRHGPTKEEITPK